MSGALTPKTEGRSRRSRQARPRERPAAAATVDTTSSLPWRQPGSV
jgi:hypothetical protein